MSLDTLPPLDALTNWVRTHDDHAAHRLELLAEAEAILRRSLAVGGERRRVLAGRLQRWRYQRLNEFAGNLPPEERRLSDALDLAANALLDRPPRPARWPRGAVHSPEGGAAAQRAVAALDQRLPLDELARQAREITFEHFASASQSGTTRTRRMLMYAPLYLSSECVNHCTYCGFSYPLEIPRRHLSLRPVLAEAEILRRRGFRHLLLVAGDFPSRTTTVYFAEAIQALSARGFQPAVEIAPQSTEAYEELVRAGACGVTLYMETYDEEMYAAHHLRGPKTSYDWRLEGLERAAEAGMSRLGMGILLGLAEPREDLLALVRHAEYLAERSPHSRLAFSLPRIHEAPEDFEIPYAVDDESFVRFYCALRIAFPKAELVLSTRETRALRERLAQTCITQMSAGSSTTPGGYGDEAEGHSGEQFPVHDERQPAEVADRLRHTGFVPVWSLDECQ